MKKKEKKKKRRQIGKVGGRGSGTRLGGPFRAKGTWAIGPIALVHKLGYCVSLGSGPKMLSWKGV